MAEWASPADALRTLRSRFQNNVGDSFSKLTAQDYIRLVVIIGAYCLLRPYILKFGGRYQMKDHARPMAENEPSSGAAMNPNNLRGMVNVPEDTDSEEEIQVDRKGWGGKARRRQRQFIRRLIEEEEKKAAAEDSDEDIKEFLE
jgi:hypothetical protein